MKRYLFLLSCVLFAFVLSCERSLVEEPSGTSAQDEIDGFKELTESARQYYTRELKKTMETGQSARIGALPGVKEMSGRKAADKSIGLKAYALWNKAVTSKVGGVTRTEVPLSFSSRIVSLLTVPRDSVDERPDRSMLSTIFDRLVIFHGEDGFTQKIIRFHPDKSYLDRHEFDASHNYLHKLDKDFSGYLEYMEITGERRAIVRVVDGMPVRIFGMKRQKGVAPSRMAAQDSKVTAMSSLDCIDVCEDIIGEICVENPANPDDPGDMICTEEVVGENCYPDCSGGGWEPDFCDDPANWEVCYGWPDPDPDPNNPPAPSGAIFTASDFVGATIIQDAVPGIADINKYFNCFNDGKTASMYKITIYINQPNPGTSDQYRIIPGTVTTAPDGISIVKSNNSTLEVGHAFIGLEKINTDNSVVRQVIGFYPEGSGLTPGPGTIKDNGGDPYDVSYSLQITVSQFNAIKGAITDDFENGVYDLFEYNCSDATLHYVNLAGGNINTASSGLFNNTPGAMGQILRGKSGANTNGGNAPSSSGPCN